MPWSIKWDERLFVNLLEKQELVGLTEAERVRLRELHDEADLAQGHPPRKRIPTGSAGGRYYRYVVVGTGPCRFIN
jgi:hypothetical protein